MAKALIVEILGDAKQFGAELDKAAGKTRQLGAAAKVASLAIAGGLVYGLEQSVKAAAQGQAATARLDAAFKTAGLDATKYAGQIDDAESSGRKLGFTNIDTKNSLGSLVVATHNVTAATRDLSVAYDIARFKHTDLETATKTLTQAMGGSQRAIKQLGLSIQPTTENLDALKEKYKQLGEAIPPAEEAQAKLLDKQATAAAVIDLVSQKLGGQADAYAKTAQGGAAQFGAQVDALKESLGAGLLPALTSVTAALATGAEFMAKHATVTKIAVGVVGLLATSILAVTVATKAWEAAQAIATAATVVWANAQTLLNVALAANPIGLVIVAIAGLVAGLVIAYEKSKTFRDVVTAAFHAVEDVVTGTISLILSGINLFLAGLQKMFDVASHIPFVGDKFKGVADAIQGARDQVKNLQADINSLHGTNITNTITTVYAQQSASGDLKHHATGGIAQAGELAMVGEQGPELVVFGQQARVIPNGQLGSVGGGNNINISFPNYVGNERDLVTMIQNALIRIGRNAPNGALYGFG